MLYELELLGPEKVIWIEIELVEAFLGKVFTGREVGRMRGQRREQEKGVFRNTMDRAEFLGERCRDRSDFLVNLLVLEDEDSRVDGQKWQKGVRCGGQLGGECRQGGIVTDGDHLDRGGTSRARACGDVYPASDVSGISH